VLNVVRMLHVHHALYHHLLTNTCVLKCVSVSIDMERCRNGN